MFGLKARGYGSHWTGVIGLVLCASLASGADEPKTAVVKPGERYRAGWFGRLWLGSTWRDLWTTPIEVPVLDLATFDGGLTPDREGGGLQTQSLHFKSGNGHNWAFRSVDKDPKRVLEPEVRESLLGALAQELTSTENPGGALITQALEKSTGVLYDPSLLYVMPDDPRLGDLRSSFAGMLGLMELRDEKHLPGVDKELTTYLLFDRLEKRTDEKVDAAGYLRARLIDVFVGDWDRHIDQFRWVRYKEDNGARIWRVVPRDRDAAFSRFNGILPAISAYYSKPLASWGADYPSIEKLTFAGRYVDRRFLVSLDKAEWDAVTADMVAKLTDAAIDDAVHQMPKELYAKEGPNIARMLKSRRDKLSDASHDYYRLLAQDVDVRGTEGADDVEVVRNADRSVAMTLYPRDEKTGQRLGAPYFHRTFKADETDEIRLYLLGGADRVAIQGPGEHSILVRIIAVGDEAQINDQSRCGGCTDVRRERKSIWAATAEPTPKELQTHFEPTRDWGWDLLFFPQLAYDSSRGFVFGAIGLLTRYGFKLEPFSDSTIFSAAYSTGRNQPRIEIETKFRTRSPVSVLWQFTYSGIDQAYFYGLGNETVRDQNLVNSNFYKIDEKRLFLHPQLDVQVVGPLHAQVGGVFEYVSGREQVPLVGRTSDFNEGSLMAGEASLVLDATHVEGRTPSGFRALVLGRYYPTALSLKSDFAKLRGSAAYFLNGHILTDVLLALHIAGEKNWGNYPWFEAAFLGGIPGLVGSGPFQAGALLRGYDLNRYAGDASVVGNADLRIALFNYNSILPARIGVNGVVDVGRVFYEPQSSTKWHTGAGGGVWMALLLAVPGYRITTTFNALVVSSSQGTSFSLYSGFGF